jgi:hypothetical protein
LFRLRAACARVLCNEIKKAGRVFSSSAGRR